MLCAPIRIGSRSASRGETGHYVSDPSAIFAGLDEPAADVQQNEMELLSLRVSERPHELVHARGLAPTAPRGRAPPRPPASPRAAGLRARYTRGGESVNHDRKGEGMSFKDLEEPGSKDAQRAETPEEAELRARAAARHHAKEAKKQEHRAGRKDQHEGGAPRREPPK